MPRISAIAAAAALAIGVAGAAAAQEGPGGPRGDGLDFRAIDTDGNGTLSRAELQARAVARLARADANGDGALDREELIAIMPGGGDSFRVFSVGPGGAMADRLLALMGATESGRVEVAALADRRVNMLLAAVDTDRDAAISQAESEAADARRAERHEHGDRRGKERGPDGWSGRGHDGWGPQGRDGGGPRGPFAPPPPPPPAADPAPDATPDATPEAGPLVPPAEAPAPAAPDQL